METHSAAVKPFPGEITTAMDEKKIEENTRKALAEVQGAVGRQQPYRLEIYLRPRAHAHLLRCAQSLGAILCGQQKQRPPPWAGKPAETAQIPALERDIFLDNENDPDAIQAQFDKLLARAQKRKGQAIGIGHFRKNTVETLAKAPAGTQERGA